MLIPALLLTSLFCCITARTLPLRLVWAETDLKKNGRGTVTIEYFVDSSGSGGDLETGWERSIKPVQGSEYSIPVTEDDPFMSVEQSESDGDGRSVLTIKKWLKTWQANGDVTFQASNADKTMVYKRKLFVATGAHGLLDVDQVEVVEAPEDEVHFKEGDTVTLKYQLKTASPYHYLYFERTNDVRYPESREVIWSFPNNLAREVEGISITHQNRRLESENKIEHEIEVTFANIAAASQAFYSLQFHTDYPNAVHQESLKLGTYLFQGVVTSLLPLGELDVRVHACHEGKEANELNPESETCIECVAVGNPLPSTTLFASVNSGSKGREYTSQVSRNVIIRTLVLRKWSGNQATYICRGENDMNTMTASTDA